MNFKVLYNMKNYILYFALTAFNLLTIMYLEFPFIGGDIGVAYRISAILIILLIAALLSLVMFLKFIVIKIKLKEAIINIGTLFVILLYAIIYILYSIMYY
ncbi:hypothetical protein NBRC110019_26440 [Neptunitalea chrysea]|uniref:Uncharacterized protein n=1 Tax=Neptunitalea chrysea TaxID=1647581 RepID=A0A9W6EWT7_9FLAO|nr:hypothetical protein NBRC110019_26440 [Neptunitalea chrysea]